MPKPIAPGTPAGSPPQLDPGIYARVFEELRDGQMIFDELVRRFAKPAKLEGGIDAVIATYHRAGARAVLDFIAGRINQAHGVDPNEDQE